MTYTPTARATSNATLNITAPNGVSQTVTLTGTGQAATAAGNGTADSTEVTKISKPFDVTIQNSGECDWTPGTPVSSDPQFTYVSGGSSVIPAGGSAKLSYTFTPTTVGPQQSTLSFPAAVGMSLPAANVTINGFGFEHWQ